MNALELAPDFGIEAFGMGDSFDINAAFQNAMIEIASDKEIALDEKVRRMEVIVKEGESEVYRNFVDFRSMAAQMQMMCGHDHAFNQSMENSEIISSFMNGVEAKDGHDHSHDSHNTNDTDDDEYEIDPKTGKKVKRKRGWFDLLLK